MGSYFNITTRYGLGAPCAYVKLFLYDNDYENSVLRSIRIKFDRNYDFDKEIVMMIRVLSIDPETGFPSKNLISKTIVKLGKCKRTNQYIYEYKLEDFVEFPKEGVFVGMEWVYSEDNYVEYDNGSYYAPGLVGKLNTKENNSYQFFNGEWEEDDSRGNRTPFIELQISE